MKYAAYGSFLGSVLALLIFAYYGQFHYVDYKEVMPYIFLSLLIYYYLVGYYVCHKTCSFRQGLKAGIIVGAVSMIFVGVALFAVHQVFFYNEAIGEPEVMAGFKSSGMLSIKRYIVYQDIRLSIMALIVGSLFGAFAAGAGSYTANNIRKGQSCRTPHMASR
ncbi:hypothetical protein HYS00_03630 [Candidatus Microgenomates bacterium]|nr:hypothetical protein [Candidatus Microgenomates bacterium]